MTEQTNHMVLFSVRGSRGLQEASKYLYDNNIQHAMFFEPDADTHTAIATEPLRGERRLLMKKFKLKY